MSNLLVKTPNLQSRPVYPITPGVSYSLDRDRNWPIYINKQKGWVCLGDPNMEGKQLIEFAPNCIASMLKQELTAVWLHPEQLPSFEPKVKKKKWILW